MGFALLLPCTLVLWFAIAYSSFPSLLLVGLGIGLLILFCFIALAAVVFGWLGLFILPEDFRGLFGSVLCFLFWWFVLVMGGLGYLLRGEEKGDGVLNVF